LRRSYVVALKDGRFWQLKRFIPKETVTEIGEATTHHTPLIIRYKFSEPGVEPDALFCFQSFQGVPGYMRDTFKIKRD
jgi:hypothetical protein